MTDWEQYLEDVAAIDAMSWWNGLTDEERVDLFVDHGPAVDGCDEWMRIEKQGLT